MDTPKEPRSSARTLRCGTTAPRKSRDDRPRISPDPGPFCETRPMNRYAAVGLSVLRDLLGFNPSESDSIKLRRRRLQGDRLTSNYEHYERPLSGCPNCGANTLEASMASPSCECLCHECGHRWRMLLA